MSIMILLCVSIACETDERYAETLSGGDSSFDMTGVFLWSARFNSSDVDWLRPANSQNINLALTTEGLFFCFTMTRPDILCAIEPLSVARAHFINRCRVFSSSSKTDFGIGDFIISALREMSINFRR